MLSKMSVGSNSEAHRASKIRLGISSCLLGEKVRYDGGHKLDRFLTETLGIYVEYVPVCPEVECGLPVPRDAMRLVGSGDSPRLMTQRSRIDMTDQMMRWARRRVLELAGEGLCGFIFKSKSPSSGMERVKIYNASGNVVGSGPGLFAGELMRRFPLHPVEDEGRLHDPLLRENFIERIFALNRYRDALRRDGSLRSLMQFHARHKYLILSHSESLARAMGKMLSSGGKRAGQERLRAMYEAQLLDALRLKATTRKHVNVIRHMLGLFKDLITSDEQQEMLDAIEQLCRDSIPLIVPITLLKHYVRKYDVKYLKDQCYLDPHPLELMLRNHA